MTPNPMRATVPPMRSLRSGGGAMAQSCEVDPDQDEHVVGRVARSGDSRIPEQHSTIGDEETEEKAIEDHRNADRRAALRISADAPLDHHEDRQDEDHGSKYHNRSISRCVDRVLRLAKKYLAADAATGRLESNDVTQERRGKA